MGFLFCIGYIDYRILNIFSWVIEGGYIVMYLFGGIFVWYVDFLVFLFGDYFLDCLFVGLGVNSEII